MEYKALASPLRVGTLTLKNRLMMTAMHTLYPEDGHPSPRFTEFYLRRAEGGAGLITVGACRFDSKGANPSCMSLAADEDIKPWRAFTAAMRERECPVAVQLYHAGRYMARKNVPDGGPAIAPSAVYTSFTKETPDAMTEEDIQRVIQAWAAAAVRAREAGFDAVEISASAGYLITQFLSPLTNRREDAYGGSAENRGRFLREVLRAVRGAVGADYPLLLRWSAHTLVPGAGTAEDLLAFAAIAEQEGADMLSVTGGWHESRTPQLTQEMPMGALLYLAQRTKEAVSIPVAMANRMHDPWLAEQAVALGQCDAIALGRPLIADADLPRYILAGRPEKIRPCVSCNQGCLAGTFFEKPIRCLSNGLAGREYAIKETPAPAAKKLLVVGGGPAGMECALRAAARGHRVTLWEEADRLGGQMNLYAGLPHRERFGELLARYRRELAERDVAVRLGRRTTAEDALSGGFDAVVLANGRRYKPVTLPATEDAVPVYTAEQVLRGEVMPPRRVAVIGGSFVGMETARRLAEMALPAAETVAYWLRYKVEPAETVARMQTASAREVLLFEKGKPGAGYEAGCAWPVYQDLGAFGVQMHPKTEVLRATARGVETTEGFFPCEAVVFCPGTEADNTLYDALRDRLPCYRIGNADHPGRAIDAIEAGCALGCEI